MKLLVSRRATVRLYEIADYIHSRNPAAARGVSQAISDAFTMLTLNPEAGRLMSHDVRRLPVPRLPYLIYDKVDERADAVVILTVRHGVRRQGA